MLGRRNPPDSTYDFLSDPTGLPSEFKGWLRNWLLNQPATTTGTAVALPTGNAGGDLAGSTYPSPVLKASGVTAATYGDATHVGQVAVSAKGLVTSASNVSITGTPPGGSAGGDLTGTYPNPTLGTAGPGATGPIGDTTHTPVITIDAKGRVTALTSAVISGGGGGSVATDAIWTTKGDLAAATGSAAAVRLGVGSNGQVLTADSAQTSGIKWAPAGLGSVLFDSTVTGSDAASIDTGAGGIATGFHLIEVYMQHRTDDATATAAVEITVNNDTSSIYDRHFLDLTDTTIVGGNSLAQAKWAINSHGSGGAAGYAVSTRISFLGYDVRSFNLSGILYNNRLDTTAGAGILAVDVYSVGYRSTTSITRMKLAATGTQKLKVGSRLLIIGY